MPEGVVHSCNLLRFGLRQEHEERERIRQTVHPVVVATHCLHVCVTPCPLGASDSSYRKHFSTWKNLYYKGYNKQKSGGMPASVCVCVSLQPSARGIHV